MIYTLLLFIGLLGLVTQALMGAGHGGGHGHAAAHGGHIGHGHGAHGQHAGQQQGRGQSPLWSLLSPLTLFSLCLGIGAAGLLLHPLHLPSALGITAALAGGVIFYALAVRPLSGFIFQFASKPIRGLSAAISKPAEALSRFDARGRGMVRLTVDGQLVRLLATLDPDEVRAATAVLPGDTLIVTEVDERKNTCRVIRS